MFCYIRTPEYFRCVLCICTLLQLSCFSRPKAHLASRAVIFVIGPCRGAGPAGRTRLFAIYQSVRKHTYFIAHLMEKSSRAVVAKFLGGVFCWFLESWHPGILAGCTEPPRRVISYLCVDVGVNRR